MLAPPPPPPSVSSPDGERRRGEALSIARPDRDGHASVTDSTPPSIPLSVAIRSNNSRKL
ncbi:hypothetical protein EYF80_044294 [Liparis tanakae]|uniref:Uncharacterized protein n=1 Tax=Liparis tanakae TaxID=230148 RepID=A0A4Z2FX58_9TELE|nr:hypothetical protein EYF80_044294 [Liparis tanakae]